jgi:predicted RND superfamily exporter protein
MKKLMKEDLIEEIVAKEIMKVINEEIEKQKEEKLREELTEKIKKIINEQRTELEKMTPTDRFFSVLYTLALTNPEVTKKDFMEKYMLGSLIKRLLRDEDL